MEHTKHCIITGASSGLGKETARKLALEGWELTLLCRNREKSEKAISYIQKRTKAHVNLVIVDLSLMSSVREAVMSVRGMGKKIDVLINNAGSMTQGKKRSEEGWEYSNAINYLAPFMLTNMLLPMYASDARIINVNSEGHEYQELKIDKMNDLSGNKAYSHSKLCNALFTIELAKRGITAVCADPGGIRTNFGGNLSKAALGAMMLAKPFLKSPKEAAKITHFLASCPPEKIKNGGYYNSLHPTRFRIYAKEMDQSPQLWNHTLSLLEEYMREDQSSPIPKNEEV
ncbi:MAG: SDR family NAD(P)-dependent oxidoreductase [Bacteroidota bacterium]